MTRPEHTPIGGPSENPPIGGNPSIAAILPEDILRTAEAAFHAACSAGHAAPVALALFAERQKTGLLQNPVSSVVPARNHITKAVPPGLVIYCDGACEPNPGVGGWAFVVYRDGIEIHAEHGGERRTTNNVMEMTGALMALRWFAERQVIEPVRLLSDSQYVVKGCNEWRAGWKRKGWRRGAEKELANADLWRELDEALTLESPWNG